MLLSGLNIAAVFLPMSFAVMVAAYYEKKRFRVTFSPVRTFNELYQNSPKNISAAVFADFSIASSVETTAVGDKILSTRDESVASVE